MGENQETCDYAETEMTESNGRQVGCYQQLEGKANIGASNIHLR